MNNLVQGLEQQVARELVRYAVGTAMFCPLCDGSMDAREAVVLSDDKHTLVRCARCYGHPVGNIKAGAVTVYDGRALWASRKTRVWRWKEAA